MDRVFCATDGSGKALDPALRMGEIFASYTVSSRSHSVASPVTLLARPMLNIVSLPSPSFFHVGLKIKTWYAFSITLSFLEYILLVFPVSLLPSWVNILCIAGFFVSTALYVRVQRFVLNIGFLFFFVLIFCYSRYSLACVALSPALSRSFFLHGHVSVSGSRLDPGYILPEKDRLKRDRLKRSNSQKNFNDGGDIGMTTLSSGSSFGAANLLEV